MDKYLTDLLWFGGLCKIKIAYIDIMLTLYTHHVNTLFVDTSKGENIGIRATK